MSFDKNKKRKLTAEEAVFWIEVVEQMMSNSEYWTEYLNKAELLKDAIRHRIIPISLAAELAEDLKKMGN